MFQFSIHSYRYNFLLSFSFQRLGLTSGKYTGRQKVRPRCTRGVHGANRRLSLTLNPVTLARSEGVHSQVNVICTQQTKQSCGR